MDFNILPTLCALTVFVVCFRPLVRRAGSHTNIWFVGWMSLLVHYAFLVLPSGSGLKGQVLDLIVIWSLEFCGFCFLSAASDIPITRSHPWFGVELAVPVFLQSFLYVADVQSVWLRSAATLLLLLPGLHFVLAYQERTRPLNYVAGGFCLLAVGLVPFRKTDSFIVLEILLFALFAAAAYLTVACAKKTTRGIVLMAVGLATWAVSFLLQATDPASMPISFNHAIMDVPRYVVAGGTILSLLDEYFSRTESLALHDPLTGLPNRRHFDHRLHEALQESTLSQTPIACLVIDVDKFKQINDTFGHPVGDGLLQALAKRLSWNLGPRDMLARTGGDEFTAILVEAEDEFHVRFVAGAMMAAGCVPVSVNQHLIEVHLSIGIAISPQDATTSADLHRTADEAMYRSKRRGGSGIAFAHEEQRHVDRSPVLSDGFSGTDYGSRSAV